MKHWTPQQVAAAAGARLISPSSDATGPAGATIDSREAGPGALFVGLPGATAHGGRFGAQALAAGAWGVLTSHEYAAGLEAGPGVAAGPGVVLAADDPLAALQRLATAWRRELGAAVIGVTGSTGKTSTKELLREVIAPHRRVVASRANFNTEIGLPLEILGAPAGTEVLVLEMGMRGAGQIAELTGIAEPDVGVIVSIGPVHLELLGTIEAIAAAKSELTAGLAPGATAVFPAGEPLLLPHRRKDLQTLTFGENGDVRLVGENEGHVQIDLGGQVVALEVSFTQAHLRRNLLAAVAAAAAIGVRASGRVELEISAGRGRRVELGSDITLIDDSYNANPMSMRAALDHLHTLPVAADRGRRIAVLGDMLELGPDERRFHYELGEYAASAGVDALVTVGPLGAAIAEGFARPEATHVTVDAEAAAATVVDLLAPGDVVLVKASRGVSLDLVCAALAQGAVA